MRFTSATILSIAALAAAAPSESVQSAESVELAESAELTEGADLADSSTSLNWPGVFDGSIVDGSISDDDIFRDNSFGGAGPTSNRGGNRGGSRGGSSSGSPTPTGEIQPQAVIKHYLPYGRRPNQCTNPIVSDRNYIYSRGVNRASSEPDGQTLLYTFTFTEATRGKRCWLGFYHDLPAWQSDPIVQLDVFTASSRPACTGGSTANYRDLNLGRLSVPRVGQATWEDRYSDYLTRPGPCPRPGTMQSFELVSAGDNNGLSYPSGDGKGFRILYA